MRLLPAERPHNRKTRAAASHNKQLARLPHMAQLHEPDACHGSARPSQLGYQHPRFASEAKRASQAALCLVARLVQATLRARHNANASQRALLTQTYPRSVVPRPFGLALLTRRTDTLATKRFRHLAAPSGDAEAGTPTDIRSAHKECKTIAPACEVCVQRSCYICSPSPSLSDKHACVVLSGARRRRQHQHRKRPLREHHRWRSRMQATPSKARLRPTWRRERTNTSRPHAMTGRAALPRAPSWRAPSQHDLASTTGRQARPELGTHASTTSATMVDNSYMRPAQFGSTPTEPIAMPDP